MATKRYGMPYKGSKNGIAKEIVEMLPKRDNLYDLFCGGGAIIQRCLELKKYKHIYANDLNKLTIKGLKMAFNGEFKGEKRWISKEEFQKLKHSDPYVAFCFSFGSSATNYAYGTYIEPWKKALHYARVFNDFSLLKEFGIITDRAERQDAKAHYEEWRNKYIDWWCRQNNIDRKENERLIEIEKAKAQELKKAEMEEKRLYLVNALKKANLTQAEVERRLGTQMAGHYFGRSEFALPSKEYYEKMQSFMPLEKSYEELKGGDESLERLQSLESLESLERLQSLQSLQRLQRLASLERIETFPSLIKLTYSSKDYREIKIKKNSCIYCDIPYASDKKGYIVNGKIQNSFDYEAFYDWCEKQTEPLLISSYEMPKGRFKEYFCKDKRVLLASGKYGVVKQEKLFFPKTQEDIFNNYKRKVSLFMEEEIKDNSNKDVELIGHYGNDETIVNSARMSYASQKEHTQEENEKLLRLMLTNGHTSPFEQVNFTFKLHMPIFVARQWQRHRTAKINERSGRYTQLPCEFYELKENNLRTSKELDKDNKKLLINELISYYVKTNMLYHKLLDCGVVKEQARTILPLATYTTFIWQMDLHNLMHFLKLRCSEKAQQETREYAEEILRQIEDICPLTIKLFKEIVLNR